MSQQMTAASLRWAADRIRQKIKSCADELNALDGALGDGDLGVTLSGAADRLAAESPETTEDIGMLLLQYAKAFSGVSGSTYGTLLATGLLAVAKQTKGRSTVPWEEVSSLLGSAETAMAARGKSQLGDKTVLDAIEAARLATEGVNDPSALATVAVRAGDNALDQFRMSPFKQGRARIFGEKGIGRDDPGMVAFKRIVESLLPDTGNNAL